MATTYRPAPSVKRIAQTLIAKHHTDLADVRIEYVFRSETAKSGGKEVWGKARKISGLNAFLATDAEMSDVVPAEDFFVIEIAEPVWTVLGEKERTALVDHELCHCGVQFDEKEELQLVLVPHDVEEFRQVVARHGLWRPDVEAFAATAYEQLQLLN